MTKIPSLPFIGIQISAITITYTERLIFQWAAFIKEIFLEPSAGLPDPFAKISVDGSGQCHSTDTCKNTLDPKWNQHYDL